MKCVCLEKLLKLFLSRPARGAWIEMVVDNLAVTVVKVAPRKGRVD